MNCITSLDFAVAGKGDVLLTSARDQVVNLWRLAGKGDPTTAEPAVLLKTLPAAEIVESVRVVPALEGEVAAEQEALHFVTGGESGAVRRWRADASTGKCRCAATQLRAAATGLTKTAVAARAYSQLVVLPLWSQQPARPLPLPSHPCARARASPNSEPDATPPARSQGRTVSVLTVPCPLRLRVTDSSR